jgi:methylase of polypeptide subunit release factors
MATELIDGISIISNPRVWKPTYYARAFLALLRPFDLADKVVLDFGCGSGILAIYCAKAGARAIGSDINPYAIENALANAKLNGVEVAWLQSDGFSQLDEYKGKLDLIVANTPSLPGRPAHVVEREDADGYNENGSGRDLLDTVIKEGASWCKPGAILLSASSSEQDFSKTEELLKKFWSKSSVVKSEEFEFDLPMLMKYRDQWLSKRLLFERGGRLFHRVDFFVATR